MISQRQYLVQEKKVVGTEPKLCVPDLLTRETRYKDDSHVTVD